MQVLEAFKYDYEKVLEKQKDTNIYYGSEFRHHKNLERLLIYHRSLNKFKTFLTSETDTVLKEMENDAPKNDCLENIRRGKHKSASKSK